MEPRRTRNRTGIKIVKIRAVRSLMKPRNIARDRLRKALMFTWDPAVYAVCWPSSPVLPSGEVQEHVFQGAAPHLQAGQCLPVGQRGQDSGGLAGDDGQGNSVVGDHCPVTHGPVS